MELIVVLAVVVFVWARSVSGRIRRAEDETARLQREVDWLKGRLLGAGLIKSPAGEEATPLPQAGPASAPVPPPVPAAPPTPVPWQAPAARVSAAVTAPSAARAAAPPRTPPPAAAAPRPAQTRLTPPAPAGPGLLRTTLTRVGILPPGGLAAPSLADLAAWIEGRMLAVVGGIALILGAIFFLSLAFSRGWITIEMRVLLALAGGALLLGLGEVAFRRLRGIVGHVLVAVGLAIVALGLFAATRLYSLVPVELPLAGAFAAAVAAAVIAVRHDSQLVAAFGLVTVLAAPPLLGASPTLTTLLFVAAALVGTTGVALARTWSWLPVIAFALTAPQLASYLLGSAAIAERLVVLAGFWLVTVVAAGGEEARRATDRLRTTTVTLLLAGAAFGVWAGFVILTGSAEAWRGTFLAATAVAHLALGLAFLVRFGDRHPFGILVCGTGVAALTMAVPIQFGGPPVPIAWAAEAVALAWVATLRRHPYSGAVAALLGALAAAHLLAIEYPIGRLVRDDVLPAAFIGPEGLTFGFIVAALAGAGLVVPIRWVRVGLAAIGGLLTIYVLPFELRGPALVAGWTALAVAAAWLASHVVVGLPNLTPPADWTKQLDLPGWLRAAATTVVRLVSRAARPVFLVVPVAAGLLALAHIPYSDYPLTRIDAGFGEVPFVGQSGLSAAIVAAGLALGAAAVPVGWIRLLLAGIGGLMAAYVLPFELSGPALVAGWTTLAVAAVALHVAVVRPRLATPGRSAALVRAALTVSAVGVLAGGLAVAHLAWLDYPITRLGEGPLSRLPFVRPETLSLAAAIAGLAVAAWLDREPWSRRGALGAGLLLVVYAAAFEIPIPHVALAWVGLSLVALAAGRRWLPVGSLRQRLSPLRLHALAEAMPYVAAAVGLLFLVGQALVLTGPSEFVRAVVGVRLPTGMPFVDDRTYVIVALAGGLIGAGWLLSSGFARAWAGIGAGLALAWLLPFEVRVGYAVAGWAAIGAVGLAVASRVEATGRWLRPASVGVVAYAVTIAITVVAPPSRLVVGPSTIVLAVGPITDATVALLAIAAALAVIGRLAGPTRLGLAGLVGAGVAGVYLLSVGVTDAFQVQVHSRPLDELRTEAQVGLSILWSVLGGTGFAAGLLTHRSPVRIFGLALLGLATAKVFLVDLSALDVAYRVLSLVALGVLLLISATVYARLQGPGGPGVPGGPGRPSGPGVPGLSGHAGQPGRAG